MIKFFRKIRYNLMSKNKTGKYFKYAIGEIVLVVIGILIALSINNWNESRKAANREIIFLQRIHTDLVADTLYFHKRINDSKQETQNHYNYVHKSYEKPINLEGFKELISIPSFASEHLTIQNSTYLELINAGEIDIIRNNSIKIAIIDLNRKYESIGKHIQEINEFSTTLWSDWNQRVMNIKYREKLSPLFDQDYMFKTEHWNWINNPNSEEFRKTENTIGFYHAKNLTFIEYFNQLLSEVRPIIEQINNGLAKPE